MINFRHTLAAMGLLVYATSPALCEPLPADAKTRIIDLMLESVTALIVPGDPGKNAQRAMTFCRDAEKIAKRYDSSPYYDGFIADCQGGAELKLNKKSACAHYMRALQSFRAIPVGDPDYNEGAKRAKSRQESISRLGCV